MEHGCLCFVVLGNRVSDCIWLEVPETPSRADLQEHGGRIDGFQTELVGKFDEGLVRPLLCGSIVHVVACLVHLPGHASA